MDELVLMKGEPGVVDAAISEAHGGKQVKLRFTNGYGVSVIDHRGSYGTEMAVLHKFLDDTGLDFDGLCYATPVTNDVIGHIAGASELNDLIQQVKALPRNDECDHQRSRPLDEPIGTFLDALESMSKMSR